MSLGNRNAIFSRRSIGIIGGWVLSFGAAMTLVACASNELTPAPEANQPAGQADTAVDRVDGISATVESQAWSDDMGVADALTPLQVTIENNSDVPVRIRYREFALIGPEGQYYSALPPIAARADVNETAPAPAHRTVPSSAPTFRHRGFHVAPSFHYAYGGIPVWSREFHHDAFYHDTYHTTYRNLNVSTEELRQQALPEGVIESGGSVSGFLYFEQVDSELDRVRFRADLVNANNGRTLGSLSIPFDVGD